MTAVKNHEADRFLAAPPAGIFVFLVHGSDAGLVSERVHTLLAASGADPKDPFQSVRLEADRLAADPGLLLDEVQTVPLFGGRRSILVEAGGRNIAAALQPILGQTPGDCTVVVAAGNLKRDAPLRVLVERSRAGAAIECHPDEARDVQRLVEAEAQAAGLTLADDARDALLPLLGADRLTTRGEVEKLVLYARGTGRITLEDVEAIVADASATAQDAAIDGAFAGDFALIEATAARVFAEGGDAGVLVGAALRHALLLHRARLDVDAGRSAAQAVDAAARYGVSPKRKPGLERQLKSWTGAKLARAVEGLAEAVARCRREPRLADVLATRALWTVALAAANRGATAG